jgi:hypothetical protein
MQQKQTIEPSVELNLTEMPEEATIEQPESTLAAVRLWTARILAAKRRWEADFKRMRGNMDFAAGIQWAGQTELDEERYVANMTLRTINQKVSSLYARDPKAIARRRKRLDYSIWDGKIEGLQQALIGAQQDDVASMALVVDYTEGRRLRDMVDRIGRTLEIVYQYYCDICQPGFKRQMKSLVRRVATCGVGYVRLNFERNQENAIGATDTETTIVDLIRRAKAILMAVADDEIVPESPKLQELKELLVGISACQQSGATEDIQERLVFDFPASTSVIVDPRCRALEGFVGANWVALEYMLPLQEVNEFFEVDIKKGISGATFYTAEGEQKTAEPPSTPSVDLPEKDLVCLWEVFDHRTKSTFFLVNGHKDYVQPPGPVYPYLNGFWPLFALCFNAIETEPSAKSTIFPPSDVQLVKSSQREWNRTRNALRNHRSQNAPKYVTGAGWLTEADKEKLANAKPGEVIELQGIPPGSDVGKLLAPFLHAPIDPTLYDTIPLQQDMLFIIGNMEATQPASNKATATAASINEQSRQQVVSSNVDDLDDFLSTLAEAAGQVLLREVSEETVRRIVGPGALWPPPGENEDFINELYLDVIAASSGRPNKAVEIANFTQIAPILSAAGANPQFIVREALKRLDDRLEPDEAFGSGPSPVASMGPPPEQPKANGKPSNGAIAPRQQGQNPAQTIPRPALVQ